jgi:hypothetical protein
MPNQRLLSNLSELYHASAGDRATLESMEVQLQDALNSAMHAASESGADGGYLRAAFPVLLLSIAARHFAAAQDGVPTPEVTSAFMKVAGQSIDWANDRYARQFRILH